MREPRLAVFISGRGSNMAAMLEQQPNYQIVGVVSSDAKAAGLKRAQRAGVATKVLGKPIDWPELNTWLKQIRVDGILLAGFMKLIPEPFVLQWSGRMINVHPSLLPAYPGLNSIAKAHSDRASVGVTVHEVIPAMDAGPILYQTTVTTLPQSWTLNDLEILVHGREHNSLRKIGRRWVSTLMS